MCFNPKVGKPEREPLLYPVLKEPFQRLNRCGHDPEDRNPGPFALHYLRDLQSAWMGWVGVAPVYQQARSF